MGRCFRYDQLLEETTGCSLSERIEDRQGENGSNQAFKWRIHLFNSYVWRWSDLDLTVTDITLKNSNVFYFIFFQKLSTSAKTTNTNRPWKQPKRLCLEKETKTLPSGPHLGPVEPLAERAYRRGHARVSQEMSARDKVSRVGLVYRHLVQVCKR